MGEGLTGALGPDLRPRRGFLTGRSTSKSSSPCEVSLRSRALAHAPHRRWALRTRPHPSRRRRRRAQAARPCPCSSAAWPPACWPSAPLQRGASGRRARSVRSWRRGHARARVVCRRRCLEDRTQAHGRGFASLTSSSSSPRVGSASCAASALLETCGARSTRSRRTRDDRLSTRDLARLSRVWSEQGLRLLCRP